MALTQVLSGMMNGLGLQSQSLRISLISGFAGVLFTYILAAQPGIRLWGVIAAMGISQIITLLLSLHSLSRAVCFR